MKRSLLALFVLTAFAAPAAAQTTRPRTAQGATAPAQSSTAATQTTTQTTTQSNTATTPAQTAPAPMQTTPTPAPPQPGICCCRVWTHGWQYSWRPNAECTTQNGTCVSPDHC